MHHRRDRRRIVDGGEPLPPSVFKFLWRLSVTTARVVFGHFRALPFHPPKRLFYWKTSVFRVFRKRPQTLMSLLL